MNWEHHVLYLDLDLGLHADVVAAALDRCGSEGWELVGVTFRPAPATLIATFKREKSKEPSDPAFAFGG